MEYILRKPSMSGSKSPKFFSKKFRLTTNDSNSSQRAMTPLFMRRKKIGIVPLADSDDLTVDIAAEKKEFYKQRRSSIVSPKRTKDSNYRKLVKGSCDNISDLDRTQDYNDLHDVTDDVECTKKPSLKIKCKTQETNRL